MIEETHEAHFGGALRIGALVARQTNDQRAGRTGRTVSAERQLVKQPRRHRTAVAHAQIDIEDFGLHFSRRRHN